MARKGRLGKEIELEYGFDRLAGRKLAQIYQLLLPEIGRWRRTDDKADERVRERPFDAGSPPSASQDL